MTTAFAGTKHAALYKKFRRQVNHQVIDKILQFLEEKQTPPFQLAVDVACGSGQATNILGEYFESVLGCDISEAQVNEARRTNTVFNIQYCVADAGDIPVADNSVDLVTCSQAAHWLDFPAFCKEVDRVLKPFGCIAVYARNHPKLLHDDDKIAKTLNDLFINFRAKTLNGFWGYPVERHYEIYQQDLIIPYQGFQKHVMYEHNDVSLSEFLGYLESYSAYQTYHKKYPENDVLTTLEYEMTQVLNIDKSPDDIIVKTVCPISLLIGRKPQPN